MEVKNDKAAEVKEEVDKIKQVIENKLGQIREEKLVKPFSKISQRKISKPLKKVNFLNQNKISEKTKNCYKMINITQTLFFEIIFLLLHKIVFLLMIRC